MNDDIDYFVICESAQTLSGMPKNLYYAENKNLFERFEHKIIHLVAPSTNLQNWQYEHFQRNYIKEGLKNCMPNDIILISDVDEIINLRVVLQNPKLQFPSLIEINMYYYFVNLKANHTWMLNLIAKYEFIQTIEIGDRLKFHEFCKGQVLEQTHKEQGWHFSYLFGFELDRYVSKIKSFSHQEYNNAYFLDPNRIYDRLYWGIDLFDRKNCRYSFRRITNQKLLTTLNDTNLRDKIHQISVFDYMTKRGYAVLFYDEVVPRLNRVVFLTKYYAKRILQKLQGE
jgi:beta-1,4-mannosyl-glycoprotein beta-1,4-N-acetylglucosaminyltransferase